MFSYDATTHEVELLGRSYPVFSILRTLVWVFGYLLLRPYLLKLGGKHQSADHARPLDDGNDAGDSIAATGKRVAGSEDDGSEDWDEDEDEGGVELGWGVKAVRRAKREERRRRREAEERGGNGEDSDREIEEMLVE